ncbi:hypothetical protein O4J56_28955 [Nocardiopsis sp. RSe5-2]|uniref:LPXTG cell wall anchor domain-containing protein n=1 Tax=Nocardiopsis endophytica TaxID=3018445 RepID=A0ABT4UCM8_9ACTN|nr:hypothetical protein [Nocardiopsis endophytica]MDA2814708.1 hypothetical protein [Nocardiopsis endophytica]
MTTRMTAGFAVFAFAALGAGPALADDAPEFQEGPGAGAQQIPEEIPQTLDAPLDEPVGVEVDYTCTDGAGGQESDTRTWYFSVFPEEEGRTGDVVAYGGWYDGGGMFYDPEGGAYTSVTDSGTIGVSGSAAPTDAVTVSASWAGESTDPYGPDEADNWNYENLGGTLDLTEPGDLVFTAGTITTTVEQVNGATTTTTCTPASSPELASITVTGDPVGGDDGDDENPGGDDGDGGGDEDPGGDDGDDQNPGGDDGDGGGDENPGGDDGDKGDDKGDGGKGEDKPAPGKDSADGDKGGSLPVTGAALGGMIAAAVAAVGGGGAAMYFSRKKRNAAADTEA